MPRSPKYCYKVVAISPTGALQSFHTLFTSPAYEYKIVTYTPNNWIKAPGNSRLFTFRTLTGARNYVKLGLALQPAAIYRCRYIGGVDGCGCTTSDSAQVSLFWRRLNKLLKKKKKVTRGALREMAKLDFGLTPVSAFLVKKLKLIKKC